MLLAAMYYGNVSPDWNPIYHEGVSFNRPLNCSFKSLSSLTIKIPPKQLSITDSMWGKSTGDQWIP